MPRQDADPQRPTAEQLAAAVQLLSRTAPAPEPGAEAGAGGWVRHAPEQGLMLRTRLDAAGQPQRQELHVLGEAFLWERGRGVRTARSHWEAQGPQALEDAQLLADRLALAARALAAYAGQDPLLLHLRAQLVQAHALQPRGATSTSYYPREGLVYAVLFILFTVAFVGALIYFMGEPR